MRFFIFLGIIAGMISMAGLSLGAAPPKPIQPSAPLSPIPMNQAEVQPAAEPSGDTLCEDEGVVMRERRIRPYGKLLDKWACYGQFNCGCSGSYKFPVPPQYTYHWPGMYSQPTMTQYTSPYRFPPLKAPPKGEDILQPEKEPNENVSERITTRPIRPVSDYRPISR
ncbi:MAG TPA: hypothetical protein PK777_13260 [Thermoguttaceae bacterium]|nr:hypothetical protein [Thermoguttaceae bacterium]